MTTGHRLVKQFNGHSGSNVFLREWPGGGFYVEKIGNTERNHERMTALLDAGYPVPKIYYVEKDYLMMEYIHGLDMKNYLVYNTTMSLLGFLIDTLDCFSQGSRSKDYTEIYHKKLDWLPQDFLFTKDELIDRLPKVLPQSTYHGDLTLENILYTDPGFHLIDPVTIEYDSYIFDIAKLRQDVECKWFLRNSNVHLDTKLEIIRDKLKEEYPQAFDNSLLILMLLRVLKHCEKNDTNYQFLMKEIHRLWK